MQTVGSEPGRVQWDRSALRRALLPQALTSRSLQNDFDDFNDLFQGAEIALPDVDVSDRVVFVKFTIKLRELYCTNINVRDIRLAVDLKSKTTLTVGVTIEGLTLDCFANHDWDWGPAGGGGTVEAYSNENFATTNLTFTSANFDMVPPSNVQVDFCNSNINIYNLEVRGNLLDKIIDAAQRLVRNVIEEQVEDGTFVDSCGR